MIHLSMKKRGPGFDAGDIVTYQGMLYIVAEIAPISFQDAYAILGDRIYDEYNAWDHPTLVSIRLCGYNHGRNTNVILLEHEVPDQIERHS